MAVYLKKTMILVIKCHAACKQFIEGQQVGQYDDLSDEASDEAMSAVLRNQDPDHFGIWMTITS